MKSFDEVLDKLSPILIDNDNLSINHELSKFDEDWIWKRPTISCGHNINDIKIEQVSNTNVLLKCSKCGKINSSVEAVLNELGLPEKYIEVKSSGQTLEHIINFNQESVVNWLIRQVGDPKEYNIIDDQYAEI